MHSLRWREASGWWVAPTRGLVRVVPGTILQERYGWEDVTRRLRDRRDSLTAWGATILAIALAVGYQLLPRIDAMVSVIRRRRGATG